MKHYLITGIVAGLLVLTVMPSIATAAEEEVIYGRQLMTEQEIAEHRERMRSSNTEQERAAYRQEQHKRVQERAKEMGVTLPDVAGPRGEGMGIGRGSGMGPREGSGRGQGMGRGMGAQDHSGMGRGPGDPVHPFRAPYLDPDIAFGGIILPTACSLNASLYLGILLSLAAPCYSIFLQCGRDIYPDTGGLRCR